MGPFWSVSLRMALALSGAGLWGETAFVTTPVAMRRWLLALGVAPLMDGDVRSDDAVIVSIDDDDDDDDVDDMV